MSLPTRVEVDDYHEFDYLQSKYKQLDKDIKVKEIGFNGQCYVGIVYYKKQNQEFNNLRTEIKKEISEYEAAAPWNDIL